MNRIMSHALTALLLAPLARCLGWGTRCRDASPRCFGRRCNAAAIGVINLIYNMARYEQIVRLKLLPLRAV